MSAFSPLGALDSTIVIAYFVLTLLIGFALAKKASSHIDGYFLGNRKIPWWMLGMSGTASNFDMTGTMVIISFVFAIGLQGFWVSMRGGMCLPLGVLMIYMGKWLRRGHVMTTAQWMHLRFGAGKGGQAARMLSAISNLIVTMAFLVYFVKGTGKFLSIFLPFSPDVCALIMIVVAVTYTLLSGFYGVIFTDVLQEILILFASVYVGFKAATMPQHQDILGFANRFTQTDWASFVPKWEASPMTWLADPHIYRLFGITILFFVARGLFEGAGGFTGGYMAQRYYAAKDDRAAERMTAQWVLLLLFRWGLVIGCALLALKLAAGDSALAALLHADPEKALPIVIANEIPAGIRGILVAGLIAAAMSTFDSTVNAGAAYWVKDIYQNYLNPNAPDRALIRQSIAATAVLTVSSVLMGLAIHNINDIWGWITGPLSAGLFAPIILRWYWWRFNGFGFAAATFAGLAAAIVFRLSIHAPLYISFPIVWLIAAVVGIATSYITEKTDEATLCQFWRQIRPFGFWGPIKREVSREAQTTAETENRWILIYTVLAVVWHVTGVVAVISLILHKWPTLAVALVLFVLLSLVLYRRLHANRLMD